MRQNGNYVPNLQHKNRNYVPNVVSSSPFIRNAKALGKKSLTNKCNPINVLFSCLISYVRGVN